MEKDVVEKMVWMSHLLAQILELAFQAFRKLNEESIFQVEEFRREVQDASSSLTKFLIDKSSNGEGGRERVKPLLSMASSFNRMVYNIDGILHQVKMMAKEEISFSDRAINELNDIFQKAMDLLESLPDLIHTQNKQSAQQIGEQVRSMFKIANGYSDEHEDRLIQGICVPKSSANYLGILESLKGVLVHTLEVSGKVVAVASKP